MPYSPTFARPYALAVFRLARESGTLPLWSDRLQGLAAIAGDEAMAALIASPKYAAEQLADLVLSLRAELAEPADRGDREVAAFVALLADNERLAALPDIYECYERLRRSDLGTREATIVSAYALDDVQIKELLSRLEPHFGSKLQARVEVDAALIGGVKVMVGDKVLDASVRGKLEAMAEALKN